MLRLVNQLVIIFVVLFTVSSYTAGAPKCQLVAVDKSIAGERLRLIAGPVTRKLFTSEQVNNFMPILKDSIEFLSKKSFKEVVGYSFDGSTDKPMVMRYSYNKLLELLINNKDTKYVKDLMQRIAHVYTSTKNDIDSYESYLRLIPVFEYRLSPEGEPVFENLGLENRLVYKTEDSRRLRQHERSRAIEDIKDNQFMTLRGLGITSMSTVPTPYAAMFENKNIGQRPRLLKSLQSLKSNELWLDSGAGSARAGIEALHHKDFGFKGSYLGISVEMPPGAGLEIDITKKKFPKRFTYLERDISKLKSKDLEALKIVTDIYGALSYTDNISSVLGKYLNSLKKSGTLYLALNSYYTIFISSSGKLLTFAEFLSLIEGIEYESFRHFEGIKITKKINGKISVPEMELLDFENEKPAFRTYLLK